MKQLLWASATVVTGDSPDYGFDNEYGAGRVDGLAGLDFHTTDISVNKTTAYEIPYYDWSRNNEPMWRLDPSSGEDWYKWDSTLLEDFDITIICDPDLMIEVILYRGTTLVAEDESSSRGDDCSISYRGTATGIYYIVVRAIGSNGAQGYPGDYYDIDVLIVSY